MKKYLLIVLLTANLFSQSDQRGEILSETPLYPLPENMTFEEYQDMNRRMSIGVGLAFIPIPGIVHRYAGEKELAKYAKQNIYGDKIVIGMGAGTISNWMRNLPKLLK